jgi:hypothetical protein
MRHTTGFPHSAEKATGNRRTSDRIQYPLQSKIAHVFTVIVETCDGQQLHPCHPARARELIRKRRAICICRCPYTIRLIEGPSLDILDDPFWEGRP